MRTAAAFGAGVDCCCCVIRIFQMDKSILEAFTKRAEEAESIIKALTERIEYLEKVVVKNQSAPKKSAEATPAPQANSSAAGASKGVVVGVDAVAFDAFQKGVVQDLIDLRKTVEDERADATKVTTCAAVMIVSCVRCLTPICSIPQVQTELEKAQYRIKHLVRSLTEEETKSAQLTAELTKLKGGK